MSEIANRIYFVRLDPYSNYQTLVKDETGWLKPVVIDENTDIEKVYWTDDLSLAVLIRKGKLHFYNQAFKLRNYDEVHAIIKTCKVLADRF